MNIIGYVLYLSDGSFTQHDTEAAAEAALALAGDEGTIIPVVETIEIVREEDEDEVYQERLQRYADDDHFYEED